MGKPVQLQLRMARVALWPVWWFCHLSLLFACLPASVSQVAPCTFNMSTESAKTPCGDNLCFCDHFRARCSGHLTYVPRLPGAMTIVDLSCNNLSSRFFTMTVFANLTEVIVLDLSYNNISWLSRDVFAEMKALKSLKLDGNEALELSSLKEILSIQGLRIVRLNNCNLSPPPADLFHNNTSHIERMYFKSNPLCGTYNVEGFCLLQFLTQLSLMNCEFKEITSSCALHELHILDLTGNVLRGFPKTCIGDGSIFPQLTTLLLSHNRIEYFFTSQVCLPSLQELDMSHNFIKVYPTGAFSSTKFPLLKHLELQYQSRYWVKYKSMSSIQANAFDNPNLTLLNLRDNDLNLGDHGSISGLAFANCSKIWSLYLGLNNFRYVDDHRFLLLFGHMQSLQTLDMSNSEFESISRNTFVSFSQLRRLLLGRNIIDNIPDGAFDSLQNLQILYLDNNKLKTIHESTFGLTVQKNLRSLTLSFNPFMCTCDLVWFQNWFQTDRSSFFTPHKSGIQRQDYKCHNIPGMALANFSMTEQACLLSREVHLLIILCCSIAIFSLSLVSLIFRYRWHIRLLMYEMFRGRDVLRRQRLQENNFDFDVFVSFASEDLSWVRQQLMANLEERLGLRLCVHERDFVPGRHIVDNIVQCVESSKKILMVFSKDFVCSQWCQFELALCLSHVMDYDDALIVVCVDDVTSRQMTSAMMGVLKTTTYIQWREEEEAAASFWGCLYLALHEIIAYNEQYV